MSLSHAESSTTSGLTDRPTILITDDSRVMRVALKRLLSDQYEVLEANNGEQAWEVLNTNDEVQMVFSDLSMPQMDGYSLLRIVRESDQPQLRELPFIVITGAEDSEETRKKALALGATDFISKPFSSAEISARASSYATHQRQLSEANAVIDGLTTADSVTGLPKFSELQKRVKDALSFAKRQKLDLGIILYQIDQWNSLVQQYSSEESDLLLKLSAQAIDKKIRTEDMAAYLGDGRFAVVVPATNSVGARYLARRILVKIESLMESTSDCPEASFSVVVTAPPLNTDTTCKSFLNVAEKLLEQVIKRGGDRLVSDHTMEKDNTWSSVDQNSANSLKDGNNAVTPDSSQTLSSQPGAAFLCSDASNSTLSINHQLEQQVAELQQRILELEKVESDVAHLEQQVKRLKEDGLAKDKRVELEFRGRRLLEEKYTKLLENSQRANELTKKQQESLRNSVQFQQQLRAECDELQQDKQRLQGQNTKLNKQLQDIKEAKKKAEDDVQVTKLKRNVQKQIQMVKQDDLKLNVSKTESGKKKSWFKRMFGAKKKNG